MLRQIPFLFQKRVHSVRKHRDGKGRDLREGENRRPDGKHRVCAGAARHPLSKTRSLTAPTVSGFLWCKMKGQSVLHQFLHRLSEKIRQEMRRYEKCKNLETAAAQGFEKL